MIRPFVPCESFTVHFGEVVSVPPFSGLMHVIYADFRLNRRIILNEIQYVRPAIIPGTEGTIVSRPHPTMNIYITGTERKIIRPLTLDRLPATSDLHFHFSEFIQSHFVYVELDENSEFQISARVQLDNFADTAVPYAFFVYANFFYHPL